MLSGIGLVSAGCSDNAGSPALRLDAAPMTCGAPDVRTYRIVQIDPSAHHATIDLDGDRVPDDELGRAYDTIAALEPAFEVAPRMSARLGGDLPWLVTTATCGSEVRVTIDQGIEVDATHVYAPQVVPRAVGTWTASGGSGGGDGGSGGGGGGGGGGELRARDGVARVPLIALADPMGVSRAPGWTDGDELTIEATLTAATTTTDETLRGRFAAAVPTDLARRELATPIAAFLDAQPADDQLRVANDTDHNGTVTAAELLASDTYRALVDSDQLVDARAGGIGSGSGGGSGGSDAGAPVESTSVAFTFVAVRVQ